MNNDSTPQASPTRSNSTRAEATGETKPTDADHANHTSLLGRSWTRWQSWLIRFGPATAMIASLIIVLVCALAGAWLAAAVASVAVAIGAVALAISRSAQQADIAIQSIQRDLATLTGKIEDLRTVNRETLLKPTTPSAATVDLTPRVGPSSRVENLVDDITAATLDRSSFPRLLATMDDGPASAPSTQGGKASRATQQAKYPEELVSCDALEMRNLVNEWHVALHTEDLATCRRIYSVLDHTAPTQTLAPMKISMEELAIHVERGLRRSFARHVADRKFREALAVGEELRRLFPGDPVALEFERIKPHLLRQVV